MADKNYACFSGEMNSIERGVILCLRKHPKSLGFTNCL